MVRIYGPDLKGIHEKASEVEQALQGIPGINDLNVQLQSEVPQIQVQIRVSEPAPLSRAVMLNLGRKK